MESLRFNKNRCIIIAEAGLNHNGSFDIAMDMVDQAAQAKVDIIKFQHISKETTYNIAYQTELKDYIEKSELSNEEFFKIRQRCIEKGIMFMSSGADVPAVRSLAKMGVPAFKISSGNFTNYQLITELSKHKKPMIFSTGMSDKEEVTKVVKYIRASGIDNFALTYCVSEYPAKLENIDLSMMQWMSKEFQVPVGFSDHTEGILTSVVARVLGACVIEKHFTLDRRMEGPDHSFSLLPQDFNKLVDEVRQVEKIIDISKIERNISKKGKTLLRRSMYYNKAMKKGDVIEFDDIAAKRPYFESGILPFSFSEITGKILSRDVELNDPVSANDFK